METNSPRATDSEISLSARCRRSRLVSNVFETRSMEIIAVSVTSTALPRKPPRSGRSSISPHRRRDLRVLEVLHIQLLRQHAGFGIDVEQSLDAVVVGGRARIAREIIF